MRTLESYLSEYAESHQNPLNIKIHNICVPAIMWSVFAFLHTFEAAELVAVSAMIYYATFRKWALWAVMMGVVVLCFLSFEVIPHLRMTAIIVFVIAWIGQFYGHHIEGKKPSFVKDLLFLLIGPLWVIVKAFPKLISPSDGT